MIKPKAIILDATAGNRMMWRHLPNSDSEYIMFIDKEENLKYQPDMICNWRELPFPDDRFLMVVFDPPHVWGFGDKSIHRDPSLSIEGAGSWWGNPKNKRELVLDMIYGQREFARVAPILCFKWNDNRMSLERALSCLDCWEEVYRKEYHRPGKLGNSKTWWITLKRKITVVDEIS